MSQQQHTTNDDVNDTSVIVSQQKHTNENEVPQARWIVFPRTK